ncbi:MAG: hypothetical protein NTU88_09270, partial [Armatimonadetes bacterium]|nr:hypothetical protein [Armatimonadota bacterium]
PLALANGGGWYDASGRLDLASEANIETLRLYCDLLNVHRIAMPTAKFYSDELWSAYREERVVGAYMPDWYGGNELRKGVPDLQGKFRICLAPALHRGGGRSGYRGGMCASVLRGPDEDVAYELVKFGRLSLDAQISLLTKNFLAPSMLAAYSDRKVRDFQYAFLGGQRVAGVYEQITRQVRPFYVGEKLLEVQKLINGMVIPEVTSGHKSPRDALREAAAALDGGTIA